MLFAVVVHLATEIVEEIGWMCTVFFEDVSIGEVVHSLLSVRVSLSVEKRIERCQGRHVDCS